MGKWGLCVYVILCERIKIILKYVTDMNRVGEESENGGD